MPCDDAVLIAEIENDLQRIPHQFNKTANKFKMNISTTKTKAMITSRTPFRCKLERDNKFIQKEMKFKTLGIEISGYGDSGTEVRNSNRHSRILNPEPIQYQSEQEH